MFTVIWRIAALDKLADIYLSLGPATRRQLSWAVDAFNHRVANHPLIEGESREAFERVTFVDMLVVHFTVDEEKQVVRVRNLKRVR